MQHSVIYDKINGEHDYRMKISRSVNWKNSELVNLKTKVGFLSDVWIEVNKAQYLSVSSENYRRSPLVQGGLAI